MSDAGHGDVLATLELLADRAREVLVPLQAAGGVAAERKGDASPVTAADRSLNAQVLRTVAQRHAGHGVLAEEGSHAPDRRRRWVCDPVDGTLGLVLGTGTSVFSLAHLVDDRLVAAVVDVPARAERFLVLPDGGLRRTVDGIVRPTPDEPAAAPEGATPLDGARVAVEVWPPSATLAAADVHRRLRAAGAWTLSLCAGTFAATCVARGVLRGLVLDAPDWWDVVAAAAVVVASGGVASDLAGAPLDLAGPCRGTVLAGDRATHAALVAALRSDPPARPVGARDRSRQVPGWPGTA